MLQKRYISCTKKTTRKSWKKANVNGLLFPKKPEKNSRKMPKNVEKIVCIWYKYDSEKNVTDDEKMEDKKDAKKWNCIKEIKKCFIFGVSSNYYDWSLFEY